MANQIRIVGTCVNDASIGAKAWANPGNATADDNNDANTAKYKNSNSNRLKGTTAGNLFSIPSGATIDGIRVQAEIWSEFLTTHVDFDVKLIVGGVAVGDNKERGDAAFWPTVRTLVTWGGNGQLWGLSLDDTDINASDFGAGIANENNTAVRSTAYCDYITIVVWYTEGAKDVDGDATTAVTTSTSVTKTTAVEASDTTGVTTAHSVTKTVSADGESTTSVTTDYSVEAVKTAEGTATTSVTTDKSVTKTTSLEEEDTTAVTTDLSVTKTTSVDGEATTSVTTDLSVTKTTDVSGTATTSVTTDREVLVVKPAEGEATTSVTTDSSITKTAPVEESDTTSVTTDLSITKTTSAEDDATTAVTTSTSVTKTTSVEGTATTSITTDHLVETAGGEESAEGEATTAVTTSTSITKTTNVEGTATTAVTTFSWAALDYYGEITDSVSTGDTTRGGLVVSDSIQVRSRAQADNYAPLVDMKPDNLIYGFVPYAASKSLIPMVTFERYALKRFDRGVSIPPDDNVHYLLDEDVDDITKKNDGILWVAFPGAGFDAYFKVGFSSVSNKYPDVNSFKLRIRRDYDQQGGQFEQTVDIVIDWGTSSYSTSLLFDTDVTDEITEIDVTGVSLNALEVNAITARFYSQGIAEIGFADLISIFYDIDILIPEIYKEKQIETETFSGKTIDTGFDTGKGIGDPGWSEDDGGGPIFDPS